MPSQICWRPVSGKTELTGAVASQGVLVRTWLA